MRSVDERTLITSIADDLSAGIWVATAPEGRFVYANRAFDEIMGMGPMTEVGVGEYSAPYGIYTREGQPYPEDQLPFVRALRARATVVVDDLVIHRRDGSRVYVRASAKPMFDAADQMTHIAVAFFDITREAEAERARAEAETRVNTVVTNAPVVLFAFDRHGIITHAEGHGLERLGRESKELVGQSVYDVYPEAPNIAKHARRALAGDSSSLVVELPSKSASYDAWMAPMRDANGAVVGAIGVSTDVTDLRRAEKQLAQAERLASVGMLAAGVAHEINNPLSYVIGNLEVIARELPNTSPALSGAIDDAKQGADRVRAIVRDLKVLSRVQEQHAGNVDVRGPIHAAAAIARNEIRHRARLVLDLTAVPTVWADEGRLCQLFLNLLVNAAHAIPEGSAHRNEIRVVARAAGDGVVVEVADTGAGIPPELLPRIFDPFFTTKAAGGGTGLGLSICHGIATELGGRLEVESRVGEGTTFRLSLPASSRERTSPRAAAPSARAVATRGRVLVVDDEPLILKVLVALLEREHDIVCEHRADAALERVRRGERFDAIVCDLMMPEMSGMDLHDALVVVAPRQAERMIFMTGGAFTARARAFLDRLPESTLEKPFDERMLSERIRKVIG